MFPGTVTAWLKFELSRALCAQLAVMDAMNDTAFYNQSFSRDYFRLYLIPSRLDREPRELQKRAKFKCFTLAED